MWFTGEKPSSFTTVLNPKTTRQNKVSISAQTTVKPSLEKVVKKSKKKNNLGLRTEVVIDPWDRGPKGVIDPCKH
jgi:hypothetical protein